jgi:hypothetical protein
MGNRFIDFLRLPFNRILGRRSKPARIPSVFQTPKRENQRAFRRYPLEFDVSVRFAGNQTTPETDEGELQDISGGGAMFFPRRPEKYFTGQQIETKIYLAGTQDVQACVRSEATVVRVEGAEDPVAVQSVRVAVRFDRTFDFERMDGSDIEWVK